MKNRPDVIADTTFAGTEDWQLSRIARETTPEQRLELLEEMIAFALNAGILERRSPDDERI